MQNCNNHNAGVMEALLINRSCAIDAFRFYIHNAVAILMSVNNL